MLFNLNLRVRIVSAVSFHFLISSSSTNLKFISSSQIKILHCIKIMFIEKTKCCKVIPTIEISLQHTMKKTVRHLLTFTETAITLFLQ